MSRAASGLVRALLGITADPAHRILLSDVRSVDWQSLTFAGERHELTLGLIGPHARSVAENFIDSLPDRELRVAGYIVADIAGTIAARDGNESVSVAIEALTISEN